MGSATTDRRMGLTGDKGMKAPVRVGTTASITLQGEQTIDGIAVVDGDRVLVKDQGSSVANGIYDASTGNWTRSLDCNGNQDVVRGTTFYITDGSTLGGTYWYISSSNPITIDTSSITFARALASSGSTVTFQQAGTGAVLRGMQDKVRELLSVTDFGAVGDGTTDDTTAIQNAENSGKMVYFPTPTSFYKITSPIACGASSHWIGESDLTTIIRNTAGGSVITVTGSDSSGPFVFENLRVGGAGSTGLTIAAGGYAQYAPRVTMRNVNFEADLAKGLDANMIYLDLQDVTFGYYQQTSIHASHQAINIIGGSGGRNANLLSFVRCKFNNGKSTVTCVVTSGLLVRFVDCDWSLNVRNLSVNNVTGLIIENGYTEGLTIATGQAFDFGASRTKIRVIGGTFNGGTMAAGTAMFGATPATPLLIEGADISVSASAYTYTDSSTIAHAPISGIQHFKDCRIQGNASDPLLYLDGFYEGMIFTFAPTPSGLTVVNGTGGATYLGTYIIRGRQIFWTIQIGTTGTCTTASTGGTTYFPMPASLPVPAYNTTGGVFNAVAGTSLGVGYMSGAVRFFTPTWIAQAGNITMSGDYPF